MKVDEKTHEFKVETQDLSVFELACAIGQVKIVQFMLKELHLLHRRDLTSDTGRNDQEMRFLFAPIMKKDSRVLELIFQYLSLTRDEIRNIIYLMTQTRWVEGIELLLQSKACFLMFESLTWEERKGFMWDTYCAPHFSEDREDNLDATAAKNPQDTATPGETTIKMPIEIRKLDILLNIRKAISICLGKRPYSLAGFLMFVQKKPAIAA